MKSLFKWLFASKSESKKYKYEIILICYLLTISTVMVFLSNAEILCSAINRMLCIAALAQCFLLFIPCIARLFDISDYNERIKVMTGRKVFKFEPLLCEIPKIEEWIINASIPDTLYLKGNKENNVVILSIVFGTKGKNGPFINKQILINDKEVKDIIGIREEIDNTCMINDGCVYLLAVTEYNDPKFFYKILK